MAQFIFIYRGGRQALSSPEQMQCLLRHWMDWLQEGDRTGWMVDGGHGLRPGGAVVHSDLSVTATPIRFDRAIGGYSLIRAADLISAVELARTSPRATSGGTVEVRAILGDRRHDA